MTTFRTYEEPHQVSTEAGTVLFKKIMPVLDFKFQFYSGAPRGEKVMLQHYMWREAQEPLAGGIEMQAAKMNTAFLKAHRSLKPGPVALEARHFSGRTLCPQIKPWTLSKRLRQVVQWFAE